MGKGKGSPEFWACRVKPGRILFEVDELCPSRLQEALYKASTKLPIKCKFIKKYNEKKEIKLSKTEILKNLEILKRFI